MTINEIAQKACDELNLQDTDSLAKAIGFAKDRWKTIWNTHLWKDSVGYVYCEAIKEDNRLLLKVPLERVRNIRYGEHTLYPVDPSNVFQIDPNAFDSTGEIVAFSEMGKDEDGNRIVQLFRSPDALSQNFLVMGKIACPVLDDDDSPFLTGVEDAICEFVAGDLWKRDQQFNKANQSYSNASVFLEQMKGIDTQQSATMPRLIPDTYTQYRMFED